jgi:transketolase
MIPQIAGNKEPKYHGSRRCRQAVETFGWHARSVGDGNDTEDIASGLKEAQAEENRQSLLLVQTHTTPTATL